MVVGKEKNAVNPFTPLFGKVPAVMAGREDIIEDMIDAFEGNGSSPDLCSIFTGPRGSGKTALLRYLGYRAEQAGWIVASTTASKGMLDDLLERAFAASAHLVDIKGGKKLSGIEIAQLGGLSWDNPSDQQGNWRSRISDLLDQLSKTNTGLLLTVDEVDSSLDEMTELVTVFQHLVGEDRKVALLMAGLPYRVSTLLRGKSTSFLRRAAQHGLASIPKYEVKEAFRLTIEEGGKSIGDDALELAADAIKGFPFMFQLVGYRSWNAVRDDSAIDVAAVEKGVSIARDELATRVFDATLLELSKGDIEFLGAMDKSGGLTERAVIAKRTNRSSSWVSTYKKRLLEAGVIEETRPGCYSFALPGFDEYLEEQGL